MLHPDRCFDPEPEVRRAARTLFEETRGLPIVSPHGHVEPRWLAENSAFPEPAALIVQPDHYLLRVLYSRGVPLEALGIPRRDGTPVESDPRAVWRLFARHAQLFHGTPSWTWLEYVLAEVFGVDPVLNEATAERIYAALVERLASPEFRPRALFERFNIEVLATTDAATDRLAHHRTIRTSGWNGKVIPTFRPDALFRIAGSGWREELAALGPELRSFEDFLAALAKRRAYFKTFGCVATDHAVLEPYTGRLPAEQIEALFQRGRAGSATAEDERRFQAHLLIEMARLSVEDGLVMQLHPGSHRDHNPLVFERFGIDRGADIPIATEFTRNLQPLLAAHGNDPRFTLVLFTLDESAVSRELAPLAGHYPAVRLGAPWWFLDSVAGMERFRASTTESCGIWKTAGFTDDTRAFCSIPARHDLARRVDANYLGRLVARHLIGLEDARVMARALAYDLARQTYRL